MQADETISRFVDDAPRHTVSDFVKLTGVSRATIFRNLESIPHSRVGRFVRFSDRQIRQYLASIARGQAA